MGKRTRDVLLRFFVTADEKAAIHKRMELIGLPCVSYDTIFLAGRSRL